MSKACVNCRHYIEPRFRDTPRCSKYRDLVSDEPLPCANMRHLGECGKEGFGFSPKQETMTQALSAYSKEGE